MTYFPPGKSLLAKKGNRFCWRTCRPAPCCANCATPRPFGIVRRRRVSLLAYAPARRRHDAARASGHRDEHPGGLGKSGHALSASRDRKLLAVWNPPDPNDRRLRLFELPSGRLRLTLDGPERLRLVAFSPDGTRLAGGSKEPDVFLWDAATGTKTVLHGHTAAGQQRRLPSRRQATGVRLVDKTIRQWDVGTGQMIDVRRGHPGAGASSVTYSPDGQWIASSGDDPTVRIWKTNDNEPPTVLPDHEGRVHESFFSPDGLTISTTCDSQRQWRIWPTPAATNRLVLRGHSSYVYPVVHSPDGRLLASAGWDDDHGIRLWDAASGTLVAVLTGHKYAIFSLAFSPDSRRLVSRSDDATLAPSGTPKRAPPWPSCRAIAWRTAAGRRASWSRRTADTILTGTDKGLRCWDLATGKEQGRVPLPLSDVRALAVRPQDGLLAASGNGPNIVLFDLAGRADLARS